MGIFGLLTYLQNDCEGGFEFVKLSEIATQYKDETKREPIVLVDIAGCIQYFVSELEVQEPKILKENLEKFIRNCYDLGIRLKFVGEGMKPFSKYEHWKSKQVALVSWNNESGLNLNYCFYRGILFNVATHVLQSSDKCEYVRSLYEADDYILRYARTQGCFAILSYDSDFLIGDGARYFLSIKNLDIHSMTTYNFNRNNFAKFLNLNISQLPIFGALTDSFTGFQYQEKRRACLKQKDVVKKKFEAVAELISKLPENDLLDFNALKLKPEEILKFQNRLQFYMPEKDAELQTTQEMMGDDKWWEIIRLAQKRHITGIGEKYILQILIHRVNFISGLTSDSYKLVCWLKSLRMMIYGILFLECPQKATGVREYSARKSKVEVSEVQFDRRYHCGLLKLWSNDRSPELVYERRRVFCEALNKNLTPEMLQILDIKEEFLFSFLALFYLLSVSGSKISGSEARMFLLVTVLVNELTSKEIQAYRKPQQPNSLYLCQWFVLTVHNIQMLNSVCGDPYCRSKTNFINIFDGTLYDYLHHRMVNASWRTGTIEIQEKQDSIEPPEVMLELDMLNKKLNDLVHKCKQRR